MFQKDLQLQKARKTVQKTENREQRNVYDDDDEYNNIITLVLSQ